MGSVSVAEWKQAGTWNQPSLIPAMAPPPQGPGLTLCQVLFLPHYMALTDVIFTTTW